MKKAAIIATAIGLVSATQLMIGAIMLVVELGAGSEVPSNEALADIPAELLPIYQQAAMNTCNMPWAVLAAIGKTESDHGRSTLPGVRSGSNSAGAMGPMQFMPGTWAAMGVDGDNDGATDVYNRIDAIWGAAKYLCHEGAGDPARLPAAIQQYSGGDPIYVDACLEIAARYVSAGLGSPTVAGDYALPLDRSVFEEHPTWLSKPHHCCTPAIDIPVPVWSHIYAVTDGLAVRIDEPNGCGWGYQLVGDDGTSYVYSHLSEPLVDSGTRVLAGDQIGLTGGAVGYAGAGNSSGPHLHFGIRRGDTNFCPQPALEAWYLGVPLNPAASPTTSGCTT